MPGQALTPAKIAELRRQAAQEHPSITPEDLAALLDAIDRESLAAAATTRQLIVDLTDPDPCSFDTRGGCQAHSYIDLKPGQMCPHEEAKQWAAAYEKAAADKDE